MKWNQYSIHAWSVNTFGSVSLNTLAVTIRMSKEVVELSNVLLTIDDVDKISMEAADVAIVLFQVANCIEFYAHEARKHEETDASVYDEKDAIVHMNTAMINLISVLFHTTDTNQAVIELTKIMTCLSALEEIYEFDLNEKIQAKMEINVARQWAQGKDGSFQHV